MNENVKTSWIWLPDFKNDEKESASVVLFRRSFELSEKEITGLSPLDFKIDVSADSKYKLYINGKFVNYGPARGDSEIWYYDTFDLSDLLQSGKNVIAAEVLYYSPAHPYTNYGMFHSKTPGFYLQAYGKLAFLTADENWKCIQKPDFHIFRESLWFSPLMLMEEDKNHLELAGWTQNDFSDELWKKAYFYPVQVMNKSNSPANLFKRPIPFMYLKNVNFKLEEKLNAAAGCKTLAAGRESKNEVRKAIKLPFTVAAGEKAELILSCDVLETAFVEWQFSGGCGAEIKFTYTEGYYQKEGDGWKKYVRDDESGEILGFFDKVILYGAEGAKQEVVKAGAKGDRPLVGQCAKGDRPQAGAADTKGDRPQTGAADTKGDRPLIGQCAKGNRPRIYQSFSTFWWRTFRFIKIEITATEEPVTLEKIKITETGYPLEVKNVPEAALKNPVKKQIWDISLRTLQRCMQETYTDCPYYEQLQYAMDSRSQMIFTYEVSGDDRLARNCMEAFKRCQRSDGLINAAYPSTAPNVIPGFSIFYILMILDHIQYFGDKAFARKFAGSIDSVLNFFQQHLDDKGLLCKIGGPNYADRRYWSFIDWTKQWNETTGVPPATLQGGITMESLLYLYGLQAGQKIMKFIGFSELAEEYKQRAAAIKASINKYCCGKNNLYLDGPVYSAKEAYSQHTQVFAVLTDCCGREEGHNILEETVKNSDEYAQCSVAMSFYLFRALEKTGLYEYTKEKWKLWERMLENHLTTCVEDDVRERSDCHAWGALALYEYFHE